MIIEITICWIVGVCVGFLPFAWHQSAPITRCFYHDVVTEGYQMFRHVFVILVPACIIFTIYGMIYKVVLHQVENFVASCLRYQFKLFISIAEA